MRVLAALLVPVVWALALAAAIASVGASASAELAMEGGAMTYAATAMAMPLVVSAAILVGVSKEVSDRGVGLVAALATGPWVFGVLGCAIGLHQVTAAIAYAPPEMHAALGAMGRGEAMAPRMFGALHTAAISLGVAAAVAVRWAGGARRDGAALVTLVATVALAVAATASLWWGAHAHDVCRAAAMMDPAQRTALLASQGGNGLRIVCGVVALAALGLGAVGVGAVGGAEAAAARRARILAWVALGGALLLVVAERVLDRDYADALLALMRAG